MFCRADKENKVLVKVTGPRKLENRIAVPG